MILQMRNKDVWNYYITYKMLFGDEPYKSNRTVENIVSINKQYPNDAESTV